MNFRKLLTYLTVGTAAVIPFAGAQNPTILQGSYISNVFGQSNFILNPNAQTNVANVTTVTATVTRSTTTPLVATSEFTVAITSANGTATWATRAFDAGMKGQNCEARFTYRGFAATSKVHIKQNSNTVATLTLTPATDPRIASINFPCGDLSTATTFVVTDTAILAGTNEIGAIYTGLATNMANVAQAENVVQANRPTSQSVLISTLSTIIFSTETKDVYGEYNTATGEFIAKRAGDYLITSSVLSDAVSWTATNYSAIYIQKNGNNACVQFERVQATITTNLPNQITCTVTMAVGDVLTTRWEQSRGTTNTHADASYVYTMISRFPTSSELVVTPERQNTWGAVEYRNSQQTLFAGSAEVTGYSSFNNATWNQPTLLKGKAAVTTTNSGNDLGFSIPNLPVGSYKLEITGYIYAQPGAVVDDVTLCTFRIAETDSSGTLRTTVAEQIMQGGRPTANTNTNNGFTSFQGIYTNSAIATRNFRLEANKTFDGNASNSGSCRAEAYAAGSNAANIISFTITPLDQPSNSALYVQGPVLSGQTGSVLPVGYIGEIITSASSATGTFANGVVTQNVGTLTLTPGTWLVSANIQFIVSGSFTFNALSISTSSGSFDDSSGTQPQPATAGAFNSVGSLARVLRVTSSTPVYAVTRTWIPTGTSTYGNMAFSAVRIGSN